MSSILLHLALSAVMAAGVTGVPVAYIAPADTASLASATAGRTIVEVDNQNFNDATIYVVQGVRSVRLGRITGLTKAEFVLPSYMIIGAENLRFLVRPFASRRSSLSDHVLVSQGDVVGLVIPPF
ncbi:MAG: hypothetical protein IT360_17520 [Gemmatimonadaceae bacterium]|nr:hypothetical protein [Gemmatimonadaceae bacterium]